MAAEDMKSGLQGLDEKLSAVDRMLREDYGEGIYTTCIHMTRT